MPFKNKEDKRKYQREYMRKRREREREELRNRLEGEIDKIVLRPTPKIEERRIQKRRDLIERFLNDPRLLGKADLYDLTEPHERIIGIENEKEYDKKRRVEYYDEIEEDGIYLDIDKKDIDIISGKEYVKRRKCKYH